MFETRQTVLRNSLDSERRTVSLGAVERFAALISGRTRDPDSQLIAGLFFRPTSFSSERDESAPGFIRSFFILRTV